MGDTLLRHYHRLPPGIRSTLATVRGGYLRAWRYDRSTERLRDEALARDCWSHEQWRHFQEETLARLLHRAATRVPFYREHWTKRRARGDRAAWDVLANWPVLEKPSVRENPAAFVAADCNRSRMFHDHTSGTTGTSLDLWLSRSTVRAWYALYEARCRAWYGVSRHDRWAIVGGQLVAPITQAQAPFWIWNAALHQLYLSAYHISPETVKSYVTALRDYRVRFVLGYPSALHALAREMLAQDIAPLALTVAVANAEPVLGHQRDDIQRAFGCALRETYGMAEIVTAASECTAGRLHLWPEVGHTEVLGEDDAPLRTGQTGALVCTGLLNPDMPLIRYRVGDHAALGRADATPCACGRTLPALEHIEGRSDDLLYTPDGRVVGRLDPVFKSQLPVLEAQIVQEALDRVRVRYVPATRFASTDGAALVERIRARLGDVRVVLEPVSSIPRTGNGKFRAVVCNLNSDDLVRVRGR